MNLYLISQDQNNGYDTYSDAVVAAENETRARFTYPSNNKTWVIIPENSALKDKTDKTGFWLDEGIEIENVDKATSFIENYIDWGEWTTPDLVNVKLIGVATDGIKAGVICASYHAS
jgi:hypothetical protein